MKKSIYLLLTLVLSMGSSLGTENQPIFLIQNIEQAPQESRITVSYEIPENMGVLADNITFELENASDAVITTWKSSARTEECTIAAQEAPAACFTKSGTITLSIGHPTEESLSTAKIKITFSTNQDPNAYQTLIDLPIKTATTTVQTGTWEKIKIYAEESLSHTKEYISNLVEKTQSRPIQMLFILLLGLLMSLTPCIYPMIPITIGIIQSNKAQTLGRNFILACAYAIGIATTFALMGLLVALGGAQFGALLGTPIFIIFIVAFLGYFAGSMLGFYEVRLPQLNTTSIKSNGSLWSSFIFGAISGTVTSPCLSPGLVLVLAIVAKLKPTAAGLFALLQSGFLGFSYLFAFGIGLSIPLIIIATFSGAADKLPRSGLWMVEVKKIFGFLLLILCFGYLQPLLAPTMLRIVAGTTLAIIGIALLRTPLYGGGKILKSYVYLINSIVLLLGCYLAATGIYYQTMSPQKAPHEEILNLTQAREHAQKNNLRYIVVEFGAIWCSLCNKIKANILLNHDYQKAFAQAGIVLAHCDCTNSDDLTIKALKKEYAITGLPTVLLLDPATNKILKRWNAEILKFKPAELIAQITNT